MYTIHQHSGYFKLNHISHMLQTLSKLQIIIRKSCLIILLHGIELTEHMMDHVTEM